MLNFRLRT